MAVADHKVYFIIFWDRKQGDIPACTTQKPEINEMISRPKYSFTTQICSRRSFFTALYLIFKGAGEKFPM
jgi:hypothetical protein